jgi:hypothetical protein
MTWFINRSADSATVAGPAATEAASDGARLGAAAPTEAAAEAAEVANEDAESVEASGAAVAEAALKSLRWLGASAEPEPEPEPWAWSVAVPEAAAPWSAPTRSTPGVTAVADVPTSPASDLASAEGPPRPTTRGTMRTESAAAARPAIEATVWLSGDAAAATWLWATEVAAAPAESTEAWGCDAGAVGAVGIGAGAAVVIGRLTVEDGSAARVAPDGDAGSTLVAASVFAVGVETVDVNGSGARDG